MQKNQSNTHAVTLTGMVERRFTGSDLTQLPAAPVFDKAFMAFAHPVCLGESLTSQAADEMLVAILGCSVAICVRDVISGGGGLCHFMLPRMDRPNAEEAAMRYGNELLGQFFEKIGRLTTEVSNLDIRLYGGASLFQDGMRIAEANIQYVQDYLAVEGKSVSSLDVGGVYPRRLHFFPKSGRVYRLLMRRSDDATIYSNELFFRTNLRHQ